MSPAEIKTMESKNLVRSRTLTMPLASRRILAHELIAYTVHGPEMYWVGGVFLQLLAQLQDVVVHRPGGRVVVISPDFVEQFIAGDDSLSILHHEFQRLKFLRRQGDGLAFTDDFHFGEVNGNIAERKLLLTVGRVLRRNAARTRASSSRGLNGLVT